MEALRLRVAWAKCLGLDFLRWVTTPAHARARSRTEGNEALHGRGRDLGQRRRLLGPRVGRAPLFRIAGQTTPLKQTLDAPRDHSHHFGHVAATETRGGMKPHGVGPVRCEHTVEDERVNVHIQIQCAPKPLDDRHRPTPAVGDAIALCTAAQEPEHRATLYPVS